MGTTVLRRSNMSPKWGDDMLNRGLTNWAKGMAPMEAKFILQRLIQISFALPSENPKPGEEGVVLKTVDTHEGECILPAFTHPSLLSEYARSMHWLTGDEILPSHCMDAKELFAHMSQTEGILLAVNPGMSVLRLNSYDCEKLSRGEMPDLGNLIGTPPPMTTSAMMRAMGFESAQHLIPERTLNTVKMFLSNEPTVSYASVYTIGPAEGASEVNLGIKFSVARNPALEKLVDKLHAMINKTLGGKPDVKVVLLEDPLEFAIRLKITPFFKR